MCRNAISKLPLPNNNQQSQVPWARHFLFAKIASMNDFSALENAVPMALDIIAQLIFYPRVLGVVPMGL
jgi:hypothetical protein